MFIRTGATHLLNVNVGPRRLLHHQQHLGGGSNTRHKRKLFVGAGGRALDDTAAVSKKIASDLRDVIEIEANLTPAQARGLRFLREELSLTADQCARLALNWPKLLRIQPSNFLEKIEFFRELGLNTAELAHILSSSNTLCLSLEENIKPTVNWLQLVGPFSQQEICKILSMFPPLLAYNVPSNLEFKVTYFQEVLGLTEKQFKSMVIKCPSLLGASLETRIFPAIEFFMETFLNDDTAVNNLICKQPMIMTLNLEDRTIPRVEFFLDYFGFTRSELKKIALTCPEIFIVTHDSLDERVQFFEELGFLPYDMKRLVKNHPRILLYTVPTLKKRIQELEESLKIQSTLPPRARRRAVLRLLLSAPRLVGYDLRRKVAEVAGLFARRTGAPEAEVIEMILKYPKFILSKKETMEEKLDVLLRYGTREEVRSALLRNPALLTLSARGRLAPRLLALHRCGLGLGALPWAGTFSDAKFAAFLDSTSQRGAAAQQRSAKGGKL